MRIQKAASGCHRHDCGCVPRRSTEGGQGEQYRPALGTACRGRNARGNHSKALRYVSRGDEN